MFQNFQTLGQKLGSWSDVRKMKNLQKLSTSLVLYFFVQYLLITLCNDQRGWYLSVLSLDLTPSLCLLFSLFVPLSLLLLPIPIPLPYPSPPLLLSPPISLPSTLPFPSHSLPSPLSSPFSLILFFSLLHSITLSYSPSMYLSHAQNGLVLFETSPFQSPAIRLRDMNVIKLRTWFHWNL